MEILQNFVALSEYMNFTSSKLMWNALSVLEKCLNKIGEIISNKSYLGINQSELYLFVWVLISNKTEQRKWLVVKNEKTISYFENHAVLCSCVFLVLHSKIEWRNVVLTQSV